VKSAFPNETWGHRPARRVRLALALGGSILVVVASWVALTTTVIGSEQGGAKKVSLKGETKYKAGDAVELRADCSCEANCKVHWTTSWAFLTGPKQTPEIPDGPTIKETGKGDKPGKYAVRAACPDDPQESHGWVKDDLYVVGVKNVQWKKADGTYADGPAVVYFGSGVTLKALTDPTVKEVPEVIFPQGTPDWSVVLIAPDAAVTDKDLKDGDQEITIPADKLDKNGKYQFEAACGTSSVTITVYVVKADIVEVAFSGAEYHAVREDDDSRSYDKPHWKDNNTKPDRSADQPGDQKYPVCYTQGSTMELSATIKLDPDPAGADIKAKVKGDGPDALDIDETTANWAGKTVTLPATKAKAAFESKKIAFFNPMSIVWQLSLDGGASWCDVGTSANRVYVTLDTPKATTLFEMLLDIGCRSAKGQGTPDGALKEIWEKDLLNPIPGVKRKPFDGHNVKDDVEMKYWNPPDSLLVNQRLDGMLKDPSGNGSCIAWAQLLVETVNALGINGADI